MPCLQITWPSLGGVSAVCLGLNVCLPGHQTQVSGAFGQGWGNVGLHEPCTFEKIRVGVCV